MHGPLLSIRLNPAYYCGSSLRENGRSSVHSNPHFPFHLQATSSVSIHRTGHASLPPHAAGCGFQDSTPSIKTNRTPPNCPSFSTCIFLRKIPTHSSVHFQLQLHQTSTAAHPLITALLSFLVPTPAFLFGTHTIFPKELQRF